MPFAPRSIRMPSRTFSSSAGVGRQRSRISGCSFDTMSTRAPPFRISGSSAACSSPSTVRSATNTDCASALTTGPRRWSASLAPVERTGAGAESRGLGTTTWKARAPSRASASSASSTFTGRDWVSDRIAAASPAATPQRPNTSAKQSIHFPSIRSRSIVPVFRAGMVAERACDRLAGPGCA